METDIREYLPKHGLKITPQRLAVFEAIVSMKNHPTAENIIENVRKQYPNLAVGTVYNTLETFVEKGLIMKVKTDGDTMRYDPTTARHHHLYSMNSRRIEDYYDEELSQLIEDYFREKEIPGFDLKDVRVQLLGYFDDHQELIPGVL
ncbi:MAG: transcriptional repressor [Prolixibacteraceae bacterium]|jgi:Fur family peroxide stress response transcriptional regulator|nr:transcriptional repressor [Prolixibacteraceae bacterium]MDI9563859.1 transcriptional repressor [Bacteroidota bacterium]NLS98483.1 transcriptional repressor [Bacteroidales bacterium]OQB82304.1 MAG: Peroxide operon regulator [Bacteroidetes bacterium ADurb.Bin123]HNU77605.1 transcriptional repressor [Prolixibacteraceae bacterium]